MNNYRYIKKLSFVKDWFRYHFFEKKLSSFLGIALLTIFAVIIGYASAVVDYRAGLGLVGIFAVIFLLILYMRFPYFGLYFLIVYSAVAGVLAKIFMSDSAMLIVIGNVTDILIILVFFSVITKNQFQKTKGSFFWGNTITTTFLVLFLFYIVEALNPNMHSFLGWFSFFRKYIIGLCFFYVAFCLLKSWATIKFFIYFNLAMTTLLAVYSCKQQWFGLSNFEMRWATSTPNGFRMLLQGGLLRKWSTLSDPATSGILFSSTALQCIVLFLRETVRKTKLLLAIAFMFNALGYAYSGTRTATVILMAGIAFYGIATIYEKRTLIFLAISVGAFIVLMVMPFSPPSIGRIRSTFEGTKDLSAAIRDYDRHQVQPYLYQHPMGGGIFTCGMEGPKYNPGHFLEEFQPDSGYMKVLAEQGWVGFVLLLVTYFLVLSYCLSQFYRAVRPEIQNHSIALITMIFSLMVGQYSQFAMGMAPQVFLYFGALVFFIKLRDFDKKETDS